MNKSFHLKVRNAKLGPGGWHCACCSPAKSNRAAYVRACRKRIARLLDKIVNDELKSEE